MLSRTWRSWNTRALLLGMENGKQLAVPQMSELPYGPAIPYGRKARVHPGLEQEWSQKHHHNSPQMETTQISSNCLMER